ncbi:hypothetical protein K503DRAFT_804062 [Rhizopogon vinicolor AM-OR11-026]|uniref:F-box domain-containing protein n=1 Tax=Rhizopogon vinicolor AM-OR11-026 TaxID=1314800 RepID=A0A1B7MMK8_9AGAM|nr:hypothetical protein K503DRAFT_804062 [Rhizopogon vinicolor AM-OR11-026]
MWEPIAPFPPGLAENVLSRAPIYDLILCDLSPHTLVRLSRTCRVAHMAVACFFRRAYNINQHLSHYFPDPLQFRSLQARTGLVVSGSNALQFLDRTFYPTSDLDLYSHPGHVYEVLEWIESIGYEYHPSINQNEDWHNSVSADWDGTTQRVTELRGRDPDGHLDQLLYPQIKDVFTFKRSVTIHGGTVELKVQIIETTCNPVDTILNFHLTCVMNIITFDAAYSFYPVATFEQRITLLIPGSSSNRLDAVQKYVARGWRVYAAFRPVDIVHPSESPFIPNKTRWVGDHHCWSISLDTTGVNPRPTLSPSSERFSWDPSLHNGWTVKCAAGCITDIVSPTIHAHPVMSTVFRYNYLFSDEKLARAVRDWTTLQGGLVHKALTKQDWIWFDAEIPGFREAHRV